MLCANQNLKGELVLEVYLAWAAGIKRLWNCCTSESIWANWMKNHYIKDFSTWEAPIHPIDSFIWKDMAHVRQIALLHKYQDESRKWLWNASPNGQFSLTSAWNIV